MTKLYRIFNVFLWLNVVAFANQLQAQEQEGQPVEKEQSQGENQAAEDQQVASQVTGTASQEKKFFFDTTLGWLNVGAGYAIAPNLVLGARFNKSGFGTINYSGLELNSKWFKTAANSDSLYVKPFIGFQELQFKDVKSEDKTSSINFASNGKVKSMHAGALLGYQWLWESGFNINAGFGAQVYSLDKDVLIIQDKNGEAESDLDKKFARRGIFPAGELTFGFAL